MYNKVNAWCVSKWNGNDYVYCGIVKGEKSEDSLTTVAGRYGAGKYILNPHIDNATVDGGGAYDLKSLYE